MKTYPLLEIPKPTIPFYLFVEESEDAATFLLQQGAGRRVVVELHADPVQGLLRVLILLRPQDPVDEYRLQLLVHVVDEELLEGVGRQDFEAVWVTKR